MKYRNYDYRQSEVLSGQKFDNFVVEYSYNERKDVLVEVGKKDLQAFVQSSEGCALQKVLDKFGQVPFVAPPKNVVMSDDIAISDVRDDLQIMTDMLDDIEDIREKYAFSQTMSVDDMFAHMRAKASKLDEKIKEVKSNEKKKVE